MVVLGSEGRTIQFFLRSSQWSLSTHTQNARGDQGEAQFLRLLSLLPLCPLGTRKMSVALASEQRKKRQSLDMLL